MAPIKVITPEGEVKILPPENDVNHKFADMPGEIFKPGSSEPPTRTDAQAKVLGAYFDGDDPDALPTNADVDTELEHLQELYRKTRLSGPNPTLCPPSRSST